MRITESVIWGVVIITVTLLACTTFLIQGGHSNDVSAIATTFAPTIGTLVNLFALHRIARTNQESQDKITSTKAKLDTVVPQIEAAKEAVIDEIKRNGN